MKHHRAISRQPALAQTTLQVKLDFKSGVNDVAVTIANALITAGSALTTSLAGFATSAGDAWLNKGYGTSI